VLSRCFFWSHSDLTNWTNGKARHELRTRSGPVGMECRQTKPLRGIAELCPEAWRRTSGSHKLRNEAKLPPQMLSFSKKAGWENAKTNPLGGRRGAPPPSGEDAFGLSPRPALRSQPEERADAPATLLWQAREETLKTPEQSHFNTRDQKRNYQTKPNKRAFSITSDFTSHTNSSGSADCGLRTRSGRAGMECRKTNPFGRPP